MSCKPVTRWGNPGDGDSPLCLPPWRDAARLQGSLEEELGQLRKRSFPEALRLPGEEPRFRRPPRARSPGSGRLLEGPARARAAFGCEHSREGVREPHKFVAATAPPRLEQPLVGKLSRRGFRKALSLGPQPHRWGRPSSLRR